MGSFLFIALTLYKSCMKEKLEDKQSIEQRRKEFTKFQQNCIFSKEIGTMCIWLTSISNESINLTNLIKHNLYAFNIGVLLANLYILKPFLISYIKIHILWTNS